MKVFFLAIITLVLYETSAKAYGPRSDFDLEKRLRELTESVSDELHIDRREACSVEFVKVGCYKDSRENRAMPQMLFSDRSTSKIDWRNFGSYLDSLTCRCAKAAFKLGFTHFGTQYYGECFSSSNAASSYNRYGGSDQCIKGDYKPCDPENEENCVGGPNTNFVYEIKEGEGSGGGQVPA